MRYPTFSFTAYRDMARVARMREATTDDLCAIYNYATRPWELRSDREACACARLAQRVRARLTRIGGYHEDENGRLWPGY